MLPLRLIAGVAFRAAGIAASCEGLSSLSPQDTSISSADVVAAGMFTEPTGPASPAFKNLSAFCRVTGVIKPTSDGAPLN